MKSSDYNDIWNMCHNMYGTQDYVHVSFYRILKNNKCIFFCVEYLPLKQVIGCQVITFMDNNKTAFIWGVRVHADHQGKKIFQTFSSYIALWLTKNTKCIRWRVTTLSANKPMLTIYKKQGFNIRNKLYSFLYVTQIDTDKIKWKLVKNTGSAFHVNTFQNRLKQFRCDTYHGKLKEISDVRLVIELLIQYGKKELHFLDWKVYDLNLDRTCVKECCNALYNDWNDGRFKAFACNDNNALGMWYKDERKNVEQICVYGNNESDILMVLNEMFIEWKRKYQNRNDQTLYIFIDNDDAKNGSKLSKLIENVAVLVTKERYL